MLIQKAFELGGKDLVAKWIDLHTIGEKKNQLSLIAKELGFA
jgi:transketolase